MPLVFTVIGGEAVEGVDNPRSFGPMWSQPSAHQTRDDTEHFCHRCGGGTDLFLIEESKDVLKRDGGHCVARSCRFLNLVAVRAEAGIDAVDTLHW